MKLQGYFVLVAFLTALLLFYGCAPTMLGDIERKGDKPLLNDLEDYGVLKMDSNGENLSLSIEMPSGDVCAGEFKLTSTTSDYIFFGAKTLVYTGQWNEGQSAICIEVLNGPGGMMREAIITDPDILGTRLITICNSDPGDFICTYSKTYSFDE